MKVKFTVPGEPKAKQRPRVVKMNGFTRSYTPEQTVMYENLVKISYYQQVGDVKLNPPIAAEILEVFPIPKSVSKKKREEMINGEVFHIKKPDIDNTVKCLTDAILKIAYDDDSGIAMMTVKKIYGENPRVEITLEEI